MHVLTATTLILSDIEDYSLFAKVVAPASFCLLVLSLLWFKVLVQRGKVEKLKVDQRLIDFPIENYHHPMEKYN